MEYIGTVKQGYMFTNYLSGIEKDDIIYNYDKKKYLKTAFTPQWKLDYLMENYENDRQGYIDTFGTDKPHTIDDFKFSMGLTLLSGGKINAKYRVVEVYEIELDVWDNVSKEKSPLIKVVTNGYMSDYLKNNWGGHSKEAFNELVELGYNNHKYIIKCGFIEECDYELSEFVSYRKNQDIVDNKMYYSFCSQCPAFYDSGSYYTPNYECGSMDDTGTCLKAKLTRYNGLTKVIKIGDE